LNQAAVEGMGNAPPNAKTPKPFEHLVLGTPNMQDHRQVVVSRQPELSVKEEFHTGPIQRGHKVIKADLPNAHELGIVSSLQQRILEGDQVCICRLIGGARMQPQAVIDPWHLGRQVAHHWKVFCRDGRTDHGKHTLGLGCQHSSLWVV
jgi:hypothetical protein